MMRFFELLNRRYKLFLLLCILCMILLDLVVILARPLDLTEVGSSTWWMITKNLENGNGYKACEEAYVPNCMLTDQTTAIREPLPVLIYALLGTMTNNAPPAFQLTQLAFNLLICWLVFLLTQELGGRALGVIAALAWSVFLPTLRMEAHISGDLIAGSLVAAGTLFLVRAVKHGGLGQWIGFGFMFWLAVLSRSSA
ncbi:MAG: glycosyltransferase family 39 protein, partial [Anaerolineae bacterium]|nr:glycosyltransferase family 39 protein [Anaerolineae bacterium]